MAALHRAINIMVHVFFFSLSVHSIFFFIANWASSCRPSRHLSLIPQMAADENYCHKRPASVTDTFIAYRGFRVTRFFTVSIPPLFKSVPAVLSFEASWGLFSRWQLVLICLFRRKTQGIFYQLNHPPTSRPSIGNLLFWEGGVREGEWAFACSTWCWRKDWPNDLTKFCWKKKGTLDKSQGVHQL